MSPPPGIGLRLDGLLVLDMDSQDWQAQFSEEQLADLQQFPCLQTPRGMHIYARLPEGATPKAGPVTINGKHVGDVKTGAGHQCVFRAPDGSRRGADELLEGRDQIPLAKPWMLSLREPKHDEVTAQPFAPGGRNNRFYEMGTRLAGLLPEAHMFAAMQGVNAQIPEPLPDQELRKIAGNAAKLPQRDMYAKASPLSRRQRAVLLAEVTPEEHEWLWHQRLELGEVTLLAGPGGIGKSTIVAEIMAAVTGGCPFPGGARVEVPGGVVLLNAEGSLSKVVRPRLERAGAVLDRVRAIEPADGCGLVRLTQDLDELAVLIEKHADTRLVVIDPFGRYIGGNDRNSNDEMTEVMSLLDARIVRQFNVALLLVHHMSKRQEGTSSERVMGASAITNSARMVWTVSKDPADQSIRYLACSKSNHGPDRWSYPYRLDGTPPRIEWLQEEGKGADELIAPPPPSKDQRDAEARDIILGLFEKQGTDVLPVKAVDECLESADVGTNAAKRAKSHILTFVGVTAGNCRLRREYRSHLSLN